MKKHKKKILAVIGLLLNNLILPGLGNFAKQRIKERIWQIALVVGGIFIGVLLTFTVIGSFIGVPLMIIVPLVAWIWGVMTGISMIKESM